MGEREVVDRRMRLGKDMEVDEEEEEVVLRSRRSTTRVGWDGWPIKEKCRQQ